MKRLLTLCTLMLTCTTGAIYSAVPPESPPPQGAEAQSLSSNHKALPSANKVVISTTDGRSFEVATADDGLAPVIVKLKGEPLGRSIKTLKASAKAERLSSMQNAHNRVIARLHKLESDTGSQDKAKLAQQHLKHEYYISFNGFATKASPKTLEKLAEDPDVEAIYADATVEATLFQSVPLINADDVQRAGNTGQGVTVAVIDTGIDYKHPDLGGGFGPSYKVIGGYDFVNKDTDPMDDYGHGTHVAGIIAGNGTVKGVAPGVKLLAYKVLSAGGSGYVSDVVAGIERAMDPDGDVTTDDAADVINLSLGAVGAGVLSADTQAVETATNAGVLCVCSAGNSGYSKPWTVYSPGCAPSALTVGATDKSDVITNFSSIGPSAGADILKPDVVAPGAYITSCKMGGGYVALSGTSMAAPHVAGVAALVKSVHPDWTPAMIKAAVMQGAKDLGQPYLWQGAGRVDALKSVNLSTIIVPSSLSLGTVTTDQPIWQKHRDLTIQNISTTTQTYNVSGSFTQQGITVTVTPSQVTIPAGSSAQVGVDVSVDNSLVPEPNRPFAYYGSVVALSETGRITVPIIFLKSAIFRLQTRPNNIVVHNRKGYDATEPYSMDYMSQYPIWVPSGLYDIMSLDVYTPRIVVKENVEVKDSFQFTPDLSEAIYSTTTTPKDKNGSPLTNNRGYWFVEHIPTGVGMQWLSYGGVILYMPTTIRTSALSSDYRLTWRYLNSTSPTEWYSLTYHRDGINSNLSVTNQPSNLKHATFHYASPNKNGQLAVVHGITQCIMENSGPTWYLSYNQQTNMSILSAPFTQEVYYIPDDVESRPAVFDQMLAYNYTGSTFDASSARLLSMSAKLAFQNPANIAGYTPNRIDGSRSTLAYSLPTDCMPLGSGPQLWFGKFVNTGTSVGVETAVDNHMKRMFYSPYFEFTPNDTIPVSIYKGTQLFTGIPTIPKLYGPTDRVYYDIKFLSYCSSEVYTVQFERTDWLVAGKPGKTSVSATFDLRKSDRNPPALTWFMVTSNGGPAQPAIAGADNRITLKMVDDVAVSQVRLYCSTGDDKWIEMPVTQADGSFSCEVPNLPLDSYVSVRIVATDTSGNSLTMDLAPTFYYASPGIRSAKGSSDPGYLRINGKPVTAVFPDALYVEEPDRTSGIKVLANGTTLTPGDLVNLTGFAVAQDGEQAISASSISKVGTTAIPSALTMTNLNIGGGKYGKQAAVEDWRSRPVSGTNPVVYDRILGESRGLNNIGLLTKTWGTVTYIGSGYFYINDGSGIDDGDPAIKGIRVDGVCPGVVGSKVAVTGISSCMTSNGHVVRRIRTRGATDVAVL